MGCLVPLPGYTAVMRHEGDVRIKLSRTELNVMREAVDLTPNFEGRIVVRDASGEQIFKGNLAVGESRELKASPPVRVDSTDGAVTVALDGGEARTVGEAGVASQGTFVAG